MRLPHLCGSSRPEIDAQIDLSDFRLLRVIGKGTFARVRVAERKSSGTMYALKAIDKAKCARVAAAPNVVQERKILEQIDHPFIVKMFFAFQDEINCYFVLDLMLGGNLRYHRLARGSLGENSVRFYVAEIASALFYLHNLGICHRDIKPENILLDARGHAHLTDFNAALHYSPTKLHAAIAGTMMYMAPEMLLRTGYTWPVDFWSLGVTAYEALFGGRRPFAHACTTPAAVRTAITTHPLQFPHGTPYSADGLAAIAALLDRAPAERLGCAKYQHARGAAQLRAHAWFRGIDWARLERGLVPPPFVPDTQSTWNFDDPADSDASALRTRIHRLSHMSEKGSPQGRHLEAHFKAYDAEKTPRQW